MGGDDPEAVAKELITQLTRLIDEKKEWLRQEVHS
jgi:hypothetical protein